jgi:hypothetical protein
MLALGGTVPPGTGGVNIGPGPKSGGASLSPLTPEYTTGRSCTAAGSSARPCGLGLVEDDTSAPTPQRRASVLASCRPEYTNRSFDACAMGRSLPVYPGWAWGARPRCSPRMYLTGATK